MCDFVVIGLGRDSLEDPSFHFVAVITIVVTVFIVTIVFIILLKGDHLTSGDCQHVVLPGAFCELIQTFAPGISDSTVKGESPSSR